MLSLAVKHVFAAILFLAPQLGKPTARQYAVIVEREARRNEIDPLLIAAFITVESTWNTRAISPTYDWGLCQLHVSKHSLPKMQTHEWRLFDPATNLYQCGKLMKMWRTYHHKACVGKHHHWIGHLAFGYRVHNTQHAEKVFAIYDVLRKRFGTVLEPDV